MVQYVPGMVQYMPGMVQYVPGMVQYVPGMVGCSWDEQFLMWPKHSWGECPDK